MPDSGVIVLAELDESGGLSRLTLELMGLGLRLASDLGAELEAVVVGAGTGEAAAGLASLGARRVYSADDESLALYNPDTWQAVLEKLLADRTEAVMLAGHTPVGQDLLPRLAFALRAGLVTDCVGIELDRGNGGPLFARPVFGGNAIEYDMIKTPIKLATVRARVGAPAEPGAVAGEVVRVDVPEREPRIKTLGRGKEDRGVQLEDARVVVAGGRGMGGEEGFRELEALAEALGGAVGASRPPCDSGWAPASAQVGITGKIVAPDIYIAVAISGSSQHLSGMSESGKIIAVNQDPDAYIFKVADYGAVGDWRRVLPALREGLGPGRGL